MQKLYCFILCLLPSICLFSQNDLITIQIHTDDNPEETSWHFLNKSGEIIASDNGIMTEPNQSYDWSFEVAKDECLIFEITDSGNNGFQNYGYYIISLNNTIRIISVNDFKEESEKHYLGDCGFGRDCATAAPITSPLLFSPPIPTYWHQYTPETNGIYAINTCNNSIETVSESGEYPPFP